jgi:RHS repeat-associated protein
MKTRKTISVGNHISPLALVCNLALIMCSALAGFAQDETPNPQRGFYPGGSFAISDIESINTVNGNLILNIPIAALPPGRNGLTGKVSLAYNSKLWDANPEQLPDCFGRLVTQNFLLDGSGGNWQYSFQYELWILARANAGSGQAEHRVWMVFPDGSSHLLRPQSATGPDNPTGYYTANPYNNTWYSTDGTYFRVSFGPNAGLNTPWTLYFSDGSRVTRSEGIERIYDRNNNYVEIQNITWNGHPANKIVDQFGRYIIIERAANPGVDPTRVYDYIYMLGASGQQIMWTIKWKVIRPNKTYYTVAGSTCNTGGLNLLTVVDQIILPSQAGSLAYTFGYNAPDFSPGPLVPSLGYGEINSILLPTGAQASYHYSLDGSDRLRWGTVLENAVVSKTLSYQREYDGSSSQTTETWGYGGYYLGSSFVIGPDGGGSRESFYRLQGGEPWKRGLVYKSERPDGTVIERIWQPNAPHPASNVNPYVKTEFTSVRNSGGALVKTAIKDFNYDKNGNVTRVAEYDWVAYGSVPRDGGGNPTGIPSGLRPARITNNAYYSPTPDASDNTTDDPDVYNKGTSPNLRNAIASIETTSWLGAVSAYTEFFYDDALTTGNLIEQRSWDSTKGASTSPLTPANSISVTHQYDPYGNRTLTADAKGVQTQFIYDPINGQSNLYVTQTKVAAGTPVQRWTMLAYDFNTGQVTQSTDVDNNVTTQTTYDVFGRPTVVKEAVGTTNERWTRTEYDGQARRVVMRAALNAADDQKLVTVRHYDQLGRIRLARQLENPGDDVANETLGIKVQTRYYAGDVNNPDPAYQSAYQVVSNTYRAATSSDAGAVEDGSTMGWTRTRLDRGGRVIETQTFGADLPQPWGANSTGANVVSTEYDGSINTVTDQAGKRRRSETDALGRLIKVTEDPGHLNYDTQYSYDTLGNLRQVTQGAQTRTFDYDSLSRLTSATNPESGTMTYAYDPNGNLIEKTDARGVRTTMTYDALNRARSKAYAGTTPEGTAAANLTPPVFYFYDDYSVLPSGAPRWQGTPSKGRLIGATYGNGSDGTYYKYDALGRIVINHQRQGTLNYATAYFYNRAGAVTREDRGNPARRRNLMSYDESGRLISIQTGAFSGLGFVFSNLVRDISYTPFGGLQSETYGNGLIHSMGYNNRLQPTEIRLGRPDNLESVFTIYNIYGTAQDVNGQDAEIASTLNNGNIARIKYSVSGTVQYAQTFQYDPLNRLSYAVEHNNGVHNDGERAWYQTFSYDPHGNRGINITNTSDNVDAANTALQLTDFSGANNRITRAGFVYDAAGNLIAEPGKSYTHDAENRIVRSEAAGGVTSQYFYDGNGRRVKKVVGDAATKYEYGAGGEMIAEWQDSAYLVIKDYFYKGGALFATKTGTNDGYEYATADHLGSPRAWTDGNGNLIAGGRHDYLPFGEELFAGVGTRTTDQGYAANTQQDGQRKQFTSKERDSETGLDYFLARYYSSTQGRFTSPDEFTGGPDELFDFADDAADNPTFYADIYEPQSLNKYQYCYNNPLIYVDPDGHDGKKIAEALQKAGEAMERTPNPGVKKAALVVKIVAAVAVIASQIDWDVDIGGGYTCAKTGIGCGDQQKSKKEDQSNHQAQAQQQSQPETAPQPEGMAKPTPQPTTPEPQPSPTPDRGHRTGKRKSTHDKHTGSRSGDRHPPNYKPFRHPPKKPPKPEPTPMPNKGPKKKDNDD